MSFKHPNFKDTKSKNQSHVMYISTRSGVDKSITESDLKKELEKGEEDLYTDDEYSENNIYVKYIDERPKSHGLFDEEGIANPLEIQKEVGECKGYVWRSIVSLKEEDAKKIGYTNKEEWQNMLRKKVPDMANEMGIRTTNLRWAAAVHMESGHPHAHVIFWEKTPERMLGVVNKKTLDSIRKSYTDEIFEEERVQLLNEKDSMRDLLRDLAKNDIGQAARLIKEVSESGVELSIFMKELNQEGLAPRLYTEDEQKMAEQLLALAVKLPGKGRTAFKFMPDNIKQETMDIADFILKQPTLAASLAKNLNAVEGLTRLYTSNESAIKNIKENYRASMDHIGSSMKAYGVDEIKIRDVLNKWSEEDKSIKLSSEDKKNILDELKFDNISSDRIKDKIILKILGIENDELKNQINEIVINNIKDKCNSELNYLKENNLIETKDDIYLLSEKAKIYIEKFDKLDDVEKEIIKKLSKGESSNEELVDNKRLNYMLQESIKKNASNEVSIKKYDATIIRGYFNTKGSDGIISKDDLKIKIEGKFKHVEDIDKEYKIVLSRIEKLVKAGYIEKENETYKLTSEFINEAKSIKEKFIYTSYDANIVYKYIERSEGNLTLDKLKKYLQEEYKTEEEVEEQLQYLTRRLEKNVTSKYMSKLEIDGTTVYNMTEAGLDARESIINPEKVELNKCLDILKANDFIKMNDEEVYTVNKELVNFLRSDILKGLINEDISVSNIEKLENELVDKFNEDLEDFDISYENIKKLLNLKTIEDPIEEARDRAYKDIRERICQIIIKGAVQSQKENIFHVDSLLAERAVSFIKGISGQINLLPEKTQVLNEVAKALIKVGNEDEVILKSLIDYLDKEKINYPVDQLSKIIEGQKEDVNKESLSGNTSKKYLEHYLAILKAAGSNEIEAFKQANEIVYRDNEKLSEKINSFKDAGLFTQDENNIIKLTELGINELLKVKGLDVVEKELFKVIVDENKEEQEIDDVKKEKLGVNFEKLISNPAIFSNLYDKDPKEFTLGKYDRTIREVFGEENKVNFDELKKSIYEKYTDERSETNIEKADNEFDSIKARIEKLTLNGYAELDKGKSEYKLTEEAIAKISQLTDNMEFTRYDANVTLSYIEESKDGKLVLSQLREKLDNEIINRQANQLYERYQALDKDESKKYISIDKEGIITTTDEGKFLSIELNKLNKYLFKAKGELTEYKLKNICKEEFGENADKEAKKILYRLEQQVKKGNIDKNSETGIYKINKTIDVINKINFQIYKEGGSIEEDKLKDVLDKNIINQDAQRQFEYLKKRLNFLKEEGYLKGEEGQYSITDKGDEKKKDILVPQRDLLRKKIKYLTTLGLIKDNNGVYDLTERYIKFSNDSSIKDKKSDIPKEIVKLIEKTENNIDTGKILRGNERLLRGIYVNDEFKDIESDYAKLRDYCGIEDTMKKTLSNMSTALIVSGVSLEDTKNILQEWNIKSNSLIKEEYIKEVVEEAYETVDENKFWDKVTVISSSDWKDMFRSFGVREEHIPTWIYRGANWKSFSLSSNGIASIINDIWKSAWREVEKERLQRESQSEYLKKNLNKQQAQSRNKSVMKENTRKSKSKSLYREEEFER